MAIFICSCNRPSAPWSFCLPFSRWRSSIQCHCNLKAKAKISILLFGLPCWSLAVQNVSIHYAGVHKIPGDVLPCFDWEAANIMNICTFDHYDLHHSCICYTVECFMADLLGSHYNLLPVCVNNISWVWICTDKFYNSIVLPNSGHQVGVATLAWFVRTTDHSTRFMNTLWKICLFNS